MVVTILDWCFARDGPGGGVRVRPATVRYPNRYGLCSARHAHHRSCSPVARCQVDRPRCRIGRLPVTYIYMNGSRYVRRLPRFFGSPVMRLWSLETLYSAVRGRTSPFSGSSRGGVREAERGRGSWLGDAQAHRHRPRLTPGRGRGGAAGAPTPRSSPRRSRIQRPASPVAPGWAKAQT